MNLPAQPYFAFTTDVDWASDYAIRHLLDLFERYGVRPTVFATHPSVVLDEFYAAGKIDLGIHPNFLPGSTHGSDTNAVIDHMCQAFPMARSFRSHCFVDGTPITRELAARGFLFDSNLCLYLQDDLTPLRHESGLLRFPVFWEDDTHWTRTDGIWDFDSYLSKFTTPGLKVINVHPFFVTANIPNQDYYTKVRDHIQTVSSDTVGEIRYAGEGAETFLIQLLEALATRGERVFTLAELHASFTADDQTVDQEQTAGRHSSHTDEDHRRYWSASDRERQEFLRQSYAQRNPTDVYATSRDHNMRELEIASLAKQIGEKGKVIDLGCGNGYTLLSLAKSLTDWELIGIDFSDNLIDGAKQLRADTAGELRSQPDFQCADAIAYLAACESETARYIITERFLLNLPSRDVQKQVIRDAFRVLCPGGRLLMCEGSETGFEALNDLRESVGLDRVPATSKENVSSLRFVDTEIEDFLQREVGFVLRDKCGYAGYFVMTRVLHPLLIEPLSPSFDSRINNVAATVQHCMPFEPGYGSNVLWVLEKPAPER